MSFRVLQAAFAALFACVGGATSATTLTYDYVGGPMYCPISGSVFYDAGACQDVDGALIYEEVMSGRMVLDVSPLADMSVRNGRIDLWSFRNYDSPTASTGYRFTDASGETMAGEVDGTYMDVPFLVSVSGLIETFFRPSTIAPNTVSLIFDGDGNITGWEGGHSDGGASDWRWSSSSFDAFSTYGSSCVPGSPWHEDICSTGPGQWITQSTVPASPAALVAQPVSPVPVPFGLPLIVSALGALAWINALRRRS